MLSTQAIANTLLLMGAKEKILLTPMKLQKLVYILYKCYYKETGKKLFTESFQKWQYGPVLPSLYYEFKSFGSSPITNFAHDAKGSVEVVNLDANQNANRIFISVWNNYKGYSAIELSSFTHRKDTAWSKAKSLLNDEDIKNEPEFI